MSKTAIILGATGLTGGLLLEKLIVDERYTKLKLFSRSAVGINHPKIEEHLIDLMELEKFSDSFMADEVFCCIGTTKKKTPDEDKYRKIDFGIPVAAAKLCAHNQIKTFVVMSSMGANEKSSVFYSRTKGEMESAVQSEQIPNTFILRPSLIKGDRNEKRFAEKLMAGLMTFLDLFMIGGLKKYRSIKAERIAEAMKVLANQKLKTQILDSKQIQEIADQGGIGPL